MSRHLELKVEQQGFQINDGLFSSKLGYRYGSNKHVARDCLGFIKYYQIPLLERKNLEMNISIEDADWYTDII